MKSYMDHELVLDKGPLQFFQIVRACNLRNSALCYIKWSKTCHVIVYSNFECTN